MYSIFHLFIKSLGLSLLVKNRPLKSLLLSRFPLSKMYTFKGCSSKNFTFASLNYSITSAIDDLDSISTHGLERKLLKHNWLVKFVQRWNLFGYKLDKSVSTLYHLDFGMDLYYSRSSNHDFDAIQSLLYNAIHELEALLTCFKDPQFPLDLVSISTKMWE